MRGRRPVLRLRRLVRPLVGLDSGGRRRWGWTEVSLTSERLLARHRLGGVTILRLDRRRILGAEVVEPGVVAIDYLVVGRPWAGLVDQDPQVGEERVMLYAGKAASEWARRLNRIRGSRGPGGGA